MITIMKVALVTNHSEKSQKAVAQLEQELADAGIEQDQTQPDIVISVGGDGTLLSAFHQYVHQLHRVQFVGIHTGHLGFYTDWRDYEVKELVKSLTEDVGHSVTYPLLDVTIEFHSKPDQHFLALNECSVRRINQTMVADVYIKEEKFERFRGDGLTVATPTGSTGYNKSIGGAVIHPRVNALQLTEFASLNNRVYRTLGSPMIIASDEWVRLVLEEADDYFIGIDQLNFQDKDVKQVTLKVAKERIQFASYRHTHFWRRVKDAFIRKCEDDEVES